MKKQKTRKELEKESKEWRTLFIIYLIFTMVFGVLFLVYAGKSSDLKTQLSECQDEKCKIYNNLYQSLGCNLKFNESSYNRALNEWEINCVYYSYKIKELCQEQVPVWTLKVKYQATNMTEPSHCAFNIHCIVYWDDYRLEKSFSSYQDYENALKEFKNMCKREYIQNCEVLE